MNKTWFTFTNKKNIYIYKLFWKFFANKPQKNTKFIMATFPIKIPDHSFIPHEFNTHIPEYFHQRDKSSNHFHLLSSTLVHLLSSTWNRGWTSGGVSNLLQLPNLSLVPLVRRNFRWTNEVTLFQPSVRSLVKIYRITVLISGRRKPPNPGHR